MKSRMHKSRIPYYILFLVIVISVSFIVYFAYVSESQFQECVQSVKESESQGRIQNGTVSVLFFSSNISNSEIISLIKSYGLTGSITGSISYYTSAHIDVPNGTEFEWICRFKQNKTVFSAHTNHIGTRN